MNQNNTVLVLPPPNHDSLVGVALCVLLHQHQFYLVINKEIWLWTNDKILTVTSASNWIENNLRILYLITFICGSSFSSVALVNSNLFKLRIFSMGLSNYHKKNFKPKDFFQLYC